MSIKIIFVFIFFRLCILSCIAQNNIIQQTSNDSFEHALSIKDSVIGPLNVFKASDPEKILYMTSDMRTQLHKENPAYFKFTVLKDTLLTFDIVPEDPTEDYDFLLYRCSSRTCVEDIKKKNIKPTRFCISINEEKNSSTGLSINSKAPGIGGGIGPAYASALPVKAGEVYYLVICYPEFYFTEQLKPFPKGFKIYFYDNWLQKPGRKVILEGVYFEQGKAILMKQSFIALDNLVKQLKNDPVMKIEISGHSDNQGNQAANQKLSEMRAKVVTDYLISKNIAQQRLTFKGFGGTKPISSNDTEEGRKKNRRVEFVVLSR